MADLDDIDLEGVDLDEIFQEPSHTVDLTRDENPTGNVDVGNLFENENPDRRTKEWNGALSRMGLSEKKQQAADLSGDDLYDIGDTFTDAPENEVTQERKYGLDLDAAKTYVYPTNRPVRDYQYNIVRRCLFKDTLVSLPTGLGKTFIAAVVMLNFYRWFPRSKIIFMAPTTALVHQQAEACHGIVGLPMDDASILTGDVTKAERRGIWQDKRIVYATPHVVDNDLSDGLVDPHYISLMVIDEAHHARGNYAYCNAVRYVLSRNKFLRILALTATPASDRETAQTVINNLHIGHIEMRREDSMDVAPYLQKKHQQLVSVDFDPVSPLARFRSLLSQVMNSYIMGVASDFPSLQRGDLSTTKPFSVFRLLRDPNTKSYQKAKLLAAHDLCKCMEYLLVHSVTEFVEYVNKLHSRKGIRDDPAFQKLHHEVLVYRTSAARFQFAHPKMAYLREAIQDHFFRQTRLDANGNGTSQTWTDARCIVFCKYIQTVKEVMDNLSVQPIEGIRPLEFLGKKSMSQKMQLEVIRKLKSGEVNVIVATSVAEEGLDIGELSLVVFWDVSSSPIKAAQRIGRTGRSAEGHIVVLAFKDYEDKNLSRAQEGYKNLQHSLANSDTDFELYTDNQRLNPIDAQCDRQHIQCEPFDITRLSGKRQRRDVQKEKKAVEKEPPQNAPGPSLEGFVSAGTLVGRKSGAETLTDAAPTETSSAPSANESTSTTSRRKQVVKLKDKEPVGNNTKEQRPRSQGETVDKAAAPAPAKSNMPALVLPRDTYSQLRRDLCGTQSLQQSKTGAARERVGGWAETFSKEDGDSNYEASWYNPMFAAFNPKWADVWVDGQPASSDPMSTYTWPPTPLVFAPESAGAPEPGPQEISESPLFISQSTGASHTGRASQISNGGSIAGLSSESVEIEPDSKRQKIHDNLFCLEASEEGSPQSSGSEREDSVRPSDEAFIATSDDVLNVNTQQFQMYQDSLRQETPRRLVRQSMSLSPRKTPRSDDTWSYGSFVVPDDE